MDGLMHCGWTDRSYTSSPPHPFRQRRSVQGKSPSPRSPQSTEKLNSLLARQHMHQSQVVRLAKEGGGMTYREALTELADLLTEMVRDGMWVAVGVRRCNGVRRRGMGITVA